MLATLLLVGVVWVNFWTLSLIWSGASLPLAAAITLCYLVVSYFVEFEPDMENLGERIYPERWPWWLGGYLNDWFQSSDDISRSVLRWRNTFAPGRFIAIALTDPFLGAGRRKHNNDSAS